MVLAVRGLVAQVEAESFDHALAMVAVESNKVESYGELEFCEVFLEVGFPVSPLSIRLKRHASDKFVPEDHDSFDGAFVGRKIFDFLAEPLDFANAGHEAFFAAVLLTVCQSERCQNGLVFVEADLEAVNELVC